MSQVPSLLAEYYRDQDPARLLIIADAMEEEPAGLPYCPFLNQTWPHILRAYGSKAASVLNTNLLRGMLPITQRTLGTYGCVLCQKFHSEYDPEFWPHISRCGKHQGPEDKPIPGEWVWEGENKPYWTRDPQRMARLSLAPQ